MKKLLSIKTTAKWSFSLVFVDVDNFKCINDTYGHGAGDECLITISNILKQYARSTDVVTRLGGDEFAIIFSETDVNGLLAIAERMREGIANSPQCYQATISVGGIVVHDQPDLTLILKAVDNLLLQAKRGKNIVVLSDFYNVPLL